MPRRSSPTLVRVVAITAAVYVVYYLWWRFTSTLNSAAMGFSLLVLAAEVQGAFNFLLFTFMTWDIEHLPAPPAPRPDLRVDILVPTYNEELDILEATLTGCRLVRYPHTTYVLDDGRRPAVAALAARLGCRYLTRPDNTHAKAGNLNAALARTDGAFIAVLDADTVPQPDYLDRTLGYFADEQVALVQLPQEFYNLDSVQHARPERAAEPWHDQTLFYRVIQPGKNRWNAAFWCGSPSVVRRAALEDVGGVATETITEDIHTTVRLHARGWKTVYHDEALAYGIAPQTLHAFAVQRLRWAQGTMQLLRSRENPLLLPGLSAAQRLNYLASTGTYFDAYQKLIYLVTPSAILLSGVLPLDIDGATYALHWAPYFALGMAANVLLGRGSFRYLAVEQFNLLKIFTFILASATLLWPRALGFTVTPKKTDGGALAQERRQLRPLLVLLGGIGASIVVGALNLSIGLTASFERVDIALMTLIWAIANASLLGYGARAVLRRVTLLRRQDYRFPIWLQASIQDAEGRAALARVVDLSRTGMGVATDVDLQQDQATRVVLHLPSGPCSIPAVVKHSRNLLGGVRRFGLRFEGMSSAERFRLMAYLFVDLPRAVVGRSLERGVDGMRAPSSETPVPVLAIAEVLASGTLAFKHAEVAAVASDGSVGERYELPGPEDQASTSAWDGVERRRPDSPMRAQSAPDQSGAARLPVPESAQTEAA